MQPRKARIDNAESEGFHLLSAVHDRTCYRHDVLIDGLFGLTQRCFRKQRFPRKTMGLCHAMLHRLFLRMSVRVFHWILMYQHRIDFHENVMYVIQVEIYPLSPERNQ